MNKHRKRHREVNGFVENGSGRRKIAVVLDEEVFDALKKEGREKDMSFSNLVNAVCLKALKRAKRI